MAACLTSSASDLLAPEVEAVDKDSRGRKVFVPRVPSSTILFSAAAKRSDLRLSFSSLERDSPPFGPEIQFPVFV
jgi:hypothetical protein